jgi:hypothetical protein
MANRWHRIENFHQQQIDSLRQFGCEYQSVNEIEPTISAKIAAENLNGEAGP